MSVKIALLGFGTVGHSLLKENEKKLFTAHSEIEVAKVLVKDDESTIAWSGKWF